jgi:20S proteasome alpha/beta subunit
MTVLVAIQAKDGVYIGSDSLQTSHWHITRSGAVKIVEKDGFVFASCGHSKASQIVKYHWSKPTRQHGQSGMDYVCSEVGNSLLTILHTHNYAEREKEQTRANAGMILAFEGCLYTFSCDGYINPVSDYAADGCGLEFAYGSLFSTKDMLPPRDRVRLAILAAGHFSAFCDGKANIIFQAKRKLKKSRKTAADSGKVESDFTESNKTGREVAE